MICLLFITLPSFTTAQTQVCGLNYGQDETWINQTFDQNSLLTYTTLDIEVAGTIRVIDGATLSITTCTLHIADDARIIVEEGATLILEGCTLLSCNNAMWDGIYIERNSNIYATGNYFYDAKKCINSNDGGYFSITENTFDKCNYALRVENYNGDHLGIFHTNTIECTQNLLPPKSLNKTEGGIYIRNVIASTPGHKLSIGDIGGGTLERNYFSDIYGVAIEIINSDVEIVNAQITNTITFGEGIAFTGGGSSADIRNIDFFKVYFMYYPTAYHMYSIWGLSNYNTEIAECSFTSNAQNHNLLLAYSNGNINIHDNSFTSNNSNSFTASVKIDKSLNNAVITNNYFHNNDPIRYMLLIHQSENVDAIGNYFYNYFSASNGISVESSNAVKVNQNEVLYSAGITAGNAINLNNSTEIEIKNNLLTRGGIGINSLNNCDYIDIQNNTIINPQWGMFLTYSSNLNVQENTIDMIYGAAIYFSYAEDFMAFTNDIDFSSTSGDKVGITMNNSGGENLINYNEIDMNGYVSSLPNFSVGIYSEYSPNTNILHNDIDNTGYAIQLKYDNNNGQIGCNDMVGAYHGIELYNAIWGEPTTTDPPIFRIGQPNNPYDNYWNNISVNSAKVFGSISSYNHEFYFKNTVGYTLWGGEYTVLPVGSVTFNSYNTSAGNFCGTPPPPIAPLSALSVSSQDDFRQIQIGFAIDSTAMLSLGSSLSSSNPQGIYSNLLRYYTVRNAYNKLKQNSSITSLGIASDAKYSIFEQNIDASNIGVLYAVENAISQQSFTQANSLLQNYIPINLAEINTYNAYGKLIQYFETDSLSSQDSALLNSIAQQNPTIGGQGVYTARNILGIYIVDPIISTSPSLARMGTATSNNKPISTGLINAYPNPANQYYIIDISGDYKEILSFKIYSIDGRLIKTGKINNKYQNKININDIESGVYFIKIFNNSEVIYNNKLIKN